MEEVAAAVTINALHQEQPKNIQMPDKIKPKPAITHQIAAINLFCRILKIFLKSAELSGQINPFSISK